MQDLICQNADTFAQVGTILWLATVLLRPFVSNDVIEGLGKAGKVVDVLTGNTKKCKNTKPIDQQDRVTKRPK